MKELQEIKKYGRTLTQTKTLLLQDIKTFLTENIEYVKANDFKIEKKTIIGENSDMFDDCLFEAIYYKYMPISYDDLIEWTKEEPILIYNLISPRTFGGGDDSILARINHNIISYLKAWVYGRLGGVVEELKK